MWACQALSLSRSMHGRGERQSRAPARTLHAPQSSRQQWRKHQRDICPNLLALRISTEKLDTLVSLPGSARRAVPDGSMC